MHYEFLGDPDHIVRSSGSSPGAGPAPPALTDAERDWLTAQAPSHGDVDHG